jgi:N-acetyl-anhydromuramyl-L-alanine amidase AmpD
MDRIEILNQQSAAELGWTPDWFGMEPGNCGAGLNEAIKAFQDQFECIMVDGWCDLVTYRRILLERQLAGLEPIEEPPPVGTVKDCVLFGGKLFEIPWDRVVTPGETSSLHLPPRRGPRFSLRKPAGMLLVHWDVTLSARSTWSILRKRGLSSHFVINWDGTIYQLRDLAYYAVHSGITKVNKASWSVDMNCPVSKKWSRKLEKLGRPFRPVLNADGARQWRVGGWAPKPFLGMHSVQVEALAALARGLSDHFGLTLEAPVSESPRRLGRVKRSKAHKLRGLVHHAEVLGGKWDTLGVDLDRVCDIAKVAA